MYTQRIALLLVEDNYSFAGAMQTILEKEIPDLFRVERATKLSQALSLLDRSRYDIILLDLTLPDSEGFNTFERIHNHVPEVPIVCLTNLDDKELALRSVKAGAQDYLIKGKIESQLLVRALQYAVERNQALQKLQQLSIIDELTGLLNRRGFYTLGEQQLKIAQRSRRPLLLFYADLDDLKLINDTHGHLAGDHALIATASILKANFRSSDIIARMGGDEFTVLSVDASGHAKDIQGRVQAAVRQFNARTNEFQISISIGSAAYDLENPVSLEEFIAQADRNLYDQKDQKHNR